MWSLMAIVQRSASTSDTWLKIVISFICFEVTRNRFPSKHRPDKWLSVDPKIRAQITFQTAREPAAVETVKMGLYLMGGASGVHTSMRHHKTKKKNIHPAPEGWPMCPNVSCFEHPVLNWLRSTKSSTSCKIMYFILHTRSFIHSVILGPTHKRACVPHLLLSVMTAGPHNLQTSSYSSPS